MTDPRVTTLMPPSSACGFRPFPDSGAYGDWTCRLDRHHRGRHRFRNYTIARVPHLHSGVTMFCRIWWGWARRMVRNRTSLRIGWSLRPRTRLHWNRAIWPAEYDPISHNRTDA